MAKPPLKGAATRQAISSLLRLASSDAQDVQTLADAGSTRNAATLLRSAITRLIEAVIASEQGYTGPAEASRIGKENPLKQTLMRLDAFPDIQPALQKSGRLAPSPSVDSVSEPLRELTTVLHQFTQHFGVDLDDTGAARTADPLRPLARASAPAGTSKSKASADAVQREGSGDRRPQSLPVSSAAALPSRPAKYSAPPSGPPHRAEGTRPAARSHSGLSSGMFWALADRWKLADIDALDLIGHKGGLTKKGTRPRFKLTEEEGEIVAAMRSLSETLEQLGLDPVQWLSAPIRPDPFRGTTPISMIRERRLQGLRDTSHYLTQMGLRLSLET
jgi:hypothetical protein